MEKRAGHLLNYRQQQWQIQAINRKQWKEVRVAFAQQWDWID